MIPLSAPSISANAAQISGAAPSALPKGAEPAAFAALLEATESPIATPETTAADMAAALMAVLAGLPDGKSGKAGGKNLPDGEDALAPGLATTEAPDEADQDLADVPIAAAIPVLPLNVPPLPGIGNAAEFRAAVPDTATARTALPNVPAQAAPGVPASPGALQAVQKQAVARSAVPAQVLGIELAPVVRAEAQPEADTQTSPATASTTPIASMKAAEPDLQGPAQNAGNLKQTPLTLSLPKNVEPGGAPASLDKLSAREDGVELTDSEPGTAKAPSPAKAMRAAPSAVASAKAAVISREAPAIAAGPADAAKQDGAEPKPTSVAKDPVVANGIGSDGATEIIQPVLHQAHSAAQTAPARILDAAPAVSTTQSSAEQPHDFATLVDRLSQAREAASPQVVRTALQHAEFGRVSLQFRHEEANLSVTLASADPAFNAAVHSAAAASLAGNSAGQGDRSDNQQQSQQQQAAPQQQSTSGNGQGQQQSAQARAEQAERMFHRGQGSSARAQQGETASSGRSDGGRRSGIYA